MHRHGQLKWSFGWLTLPSYEARTAPVDACHNVSYSGSMLAHACMQVNSKCMACHVCLPLLPFQQPLGHAEPGPWTCEAELLPVSAQDVAPVPSSIGQIEIQVQPLCRRIQFLLRIAPPNNQLYAF